MENININTDGEPLRQSEFEDKSIVIEIIVRVPDPTHEGGKKVISRIVRFDKANFVSSDKLEEEIRKRNLLLPDEEFVSSKIVDKEKLN